MNAITADRMTDSYRCSKTREEVEIPHNAFRNVAGSLYTTAEDVHAWQKLTGEWFDMERDSWAGEASACAGPLKIAYAFRNDEDDKYTREGVLSPDWSKKELEECSACELFGDGSGCKCPDIYSGTLRVDYSLAFRKGGRRDRSNPDEGYVAIHTCIDARVPRSVMRRVARMQADVFAQRIVGASRSEIEWEFEQLYDLFEGKELHEMIEDLPRR